MVTKITWSATSPAAHRETLHIDESAEVVSSWRSEVKLCDVNL